MPQIKTTQPFHFYQACTGLGIKTGKIKFVLQLRIGLRVFIKHCSYGHVDVRQGSFKITFCYVRLCNDRLNLFLVLLDLWTKLATKHPSQLGSWEELKKRNKSEKKGEGVMESDRLGKAFQHHITCGRTQSNVITG